jgi:3-oxoacyl-[acyl-carrier-protein] synthase II
MNDVVITGFGALTPVGNSAPDTWAALKTGTNGISMIDAEWAQPLPARFAGQVSVDAEGLLTKPVARRLDRVSQLALLAWQEAWQDAGFALESETPQTDPERTLVAFGTGVGGLQTTVGQWDILREKGVRRVSPFTVPMLMANAPAANIGLKIGARAGVHTAVSACASSNEALSLALDQIRLGRADIAVAGGAEACVHALPMGAFAQMQALSTRNDDPATASRPWDVDRDGFVLGEGAVVLVLETLDHAQARGAKIYGTLAGAGMSADSHDMVQPDPSGHGQTSAMVKALHESGLTPRDIVHVNAHATSTPAGDLTEAQAVRTALGDDTDHVVVTGTKSQTGHLLGAAGALETFATMMALVDRVVPPTINLKNPEPGLPIDVATTPRPLPEGDLAALNNSFGFGGHNICVAVTNQHQNR